MHILFYLCVLTLMSIPYLEIKEPNNPSANKNHIRCRLLIILMNLLGIFSNPILPIQCSL